MLTFTQRLTSNLCSFFPMMRIQSVNLFHPSFHCFQWVVVIFCFNFAFLAFFLCLSVNFGCPRAHILHLLSLGDIFLAFLAFFIVFISLFWCFYCFYWPFYFILCLLRWQTTSLHSHSVLGRVLVTKSWTRDITPEFTSESVAGSWLTIGILRSNWGTTV